jgi:hypothetical protein
MDAGLFVVGLAAFVLLGFVLIGGPMIVTDLARAHRQAVIARQIALTDALDSRLGPRVAPVVTKPFLGPWEVRIAVPLLGPAMLARMIGIVHEVFSNAGEKHANNYRVVLSVTPEARRVMARPPRRPANRWAGTSVTAA